MAERRGGHPGNPCTDGRRKFDSQREAASALGVSERTINRHLEQYGHLGNVGRTNSTSKLGRVSGNSREIRVGRHVFTSYSALARQIGCSPSWVSLAFNPSSPASYRECILARVMQHMARSQHSEAA